jgi:hypothetical protein
VLPTPLHAVGRQVLGLPVFGSSHLSVQEHQHRLSHSTVLRCWSCTGCGRIFPTAHQARNHLAACASGRSQNKGVWTYPQFVALTAFWDANQFGDAAAVPAKLNDVMCQHGRALHASVKEATHTAFPTVLYPSEVAGALLDLHTAHKLVAERKRGSQKCVVGSVRYKCALDAPIDLLSSQVGCQIDTLHMLPIKRICAPFGGRLPVSAPQAG